MKIFRKVGLLAVVLFLLTKTNVNAQILPSENFALILDTTKTVKGNILPNFRFQNLKEDVVTIENTSDFTLRLRNHAFTLANKFELTKVGDETIQSGGYLYLEYRSLHEDSALSVEPYLQMHWREARGLDRKYALGVNLRVRAFKTKESALFFGIGPFYEFERWDYRGVRETDLPTNLNPIETEFIRYGAYVSYKQNFAELFILDISAYYQNKLSRPFKQPRVALSSRLTYKFTKFLGLTFQYQGIYDEQPLVPIDKLYHDISLSLSLSF